MRKTTVLFFVMMGVLFAGCTNTDAKKYLQAKDKNVSESIAWVDNLDKGLVLAKGANKPVMADFGAEWCSWCKKMDREVFSDPQVADAAKGFVCVKVDVDKNSAVASRYGVQGLPTILFLDKEGNVVNKAIGYTEAESFLQIMKEVFKK